jgi:hypothetical protein
MSKIDPAPRALPPEDKFRVRVTLTPMEFHLLIGLLELRAGVFARYPDLCDVAQVLFDRVWELREEAAQ